MIDLETLCECEWTGDEDDIYQCMGMITDAVRINGYWIRCCERCAQELRRNPLA